MSLQNDGYQSTGCFNTKCNGFVPEKGAAIAPGDVIDRVSSPKGAKRNLNLKIIKVCIYVYSLCSIYLSI
jgi:hypothetical protein